MTVENKTPKAEPTITQLVSQQKLQDRKYRYRHRLKLIAFTFLTCLLTSFTFVVLFVFLTLRTVPAARRQELMVPEPTKILAANQELIWQNPQQHFEPISYRELPPLYRQSLIAVEDPDYYRHRGYSPVALVKAAVSQLLAKFNLMAPRGGSAIDQQLIKNVYFDRSDCQHSLTRKIQEIYLAEQLNHNFNKQKILTFYVNRLSFAENCQGIKAAMRTYFGKSPAAYQAKTPANVAQQAYLAGLGQAPDAYNLYTHPHLANRRKNFVLQVMLKQQLISHKLYLQAYHHDLRRDLAPRHVWQKHCQQINRKYRYYTDQVLVELKNQGYDLNKVSLTVHSFLQPKIYQQVTSLVTNPRYYQDGVQGLKAKIHQEGACSVIAQDGRVLALVGSRTGHGAFNRAINLRRSSGSSLKPFTAYGPLFENCADRFTTASQIDARPYRYRGTNIYMRNYANESPSHVSLQTALRRSYNTPVARICDLLGSSRIKRFLLRVGLDVKDDYGPADAIGLYVSPLMAAAAYNSLLNDGLYIKPRCIDYLSFSDHSRRYLKPVTIRAMRKSVAYVLLEMLRGVLTTSGTAPMGAIKGYQGYAAKTGTVAFEHPHTVNPYGVGGSDAWFNSVTKQGYAISIWQGYDLPNVSPAVADRFHGYVQLGRDLQAVLNRRHIIYDWEQPKTVKVLNGRGLTRQYQILDRLNASGQFLTAKLILADRYSQLKQLKTVAQQQQSFKAMPIANTRLYALYQADPKLLHDPAILEFDLYDLLKKGR